MRIIGAISLVQLLLVGQVFSDIGDWTTYTNKSDIRDIGNYENFVWCATNGGVFKYNLIDSSFEDFTNTSGLVYNDVNTLDVDNKGNVWFGLANGYINIYYNESKAWRTIDDIVEQKEHVIYDVVLHGDSLYIGLDIGISLLHHIYDQNNCEVKETYKNLGVGFDVEIPVKCIYLHDKDIWAGTDLGISRSNLNLPNLQAPNSWIYYTVNNSSIISNTIRSIKSLDDVIYVATDLGVCKFDSNSWIIINNGLNSENARDVYALIEKENLLYAGTKDGVYQLNGDTWSRIGATVSYVTSLAVGDNGDIYAGRDKIETSEGISIYRQANGTWRHFIPPGPAGNNFKSIAVDLDGILWCATKDGIFRFDGALWKLYNIKDYGLRYNNFFAVAVDQNNRKWFANWGDGAIMIDENENFSFYKEDIFSGIDIDPNYVALTNVVVDHDNNVWFTDYGAADGNVVTVITADGRSQSFSTSDGIIIDIDKELYGIAIDSNNRVWVGSMNGVTVVDHKNTIFNKTDDDLSGTLTEADGLSKNDVRAMAEDYDGIMWLGTTSGLNFWTPDGGGGASTKSGVIHDNISSIAVDIRNNKWFGTSAGVSVLSSDNYNWTHYTTDNSPLTSANVTSIAFDELTGKVYIGTTYGLSCFETAYSKPQANLDQVMAGPNPFIIGEDNGFRLLKLSENVSIKFLSSNGILVHKVSKDNIVGSYEWDGKNDQGEYVASGIYLYIIYNEATGLSKVGKVAIIKK